MVLDAARMESIALGISGVGMSLYRAWDLTIIGNI